MLDVLIERNARLVLALEKISQQRHRYMRHAGSNFRHCEAIECIAVAAVIDQSRADMIDAIDLFRHRGVQRR